jgi:hypothetical protein
VVRYGQCKGERAQTGDDRALALGRTISFCDFIAIAIIDF